MKKILILDNYDSFTYNLFHLVRELTDSKVEVVRNDKIRLEQVAGYDKVILSPGPGIPCEAGLLLPLIREYAPSKSMLGVCLGHQAIGEAFGATLCNLKNVFHGIQSEIILTGEDPIFSGLRKRLLAGRYHSWVISRENLPDTLDITAESGEGQIMAVRHRQYDVHGIQFHPESILTPQGRKIIDNFLKA